MVVLAVATLVLWSLALWSLAGVAASRGAVARLQRLVGTVVLLALACLLTMSMVLARAFHAFSDETLVAQVSARRLAADRFELTYIPAGSDPADALRIPLEGDQWAISGGIVKWHPWLTMAGLKSYHLPMRLAGQFSRADEQRRRVPVIHAFEPALDWFWEALYRLDPALPFIEAVYGSTAYVYVEPGTICQVYVTPSGYMIKRSLRKLGTS